MLCAIWAPFWGQEGGFLRGAGGAGGCGSEPAGAGAAAQVNVCEQSHSGWGLAGWSWAGATAGRARREQGPAMAGELYARHG